MGIVVVILSIVTIVLFVKQSLFEENAYRHVSDTFSSLYTSNSRLATEVRILQERLEELESRLDSGDIPYEPSEFDLRIEQFRKELNGTTYPENVATTYDPHVYNVPHEMIADVELRPEEEYAQ